MSLESIIQGIRTHIEAKADSLLPKAHSAILKGVVFGDKNELPRGLKENLRRTGTIHIVVASGYNLSVVGLYVMSLFQLLISAQRRTLMFILTELVLLFYVLLIGFQAPIIRAFIMSSLTILGKVFGRERSGVWILVLSGFIMVVIKPAWITEISFQLSFLATLGIMLYTEKIKNGLQHFFDKFSLVRKLGITYLLDDLATTLSAIIFTWPIVSYYFGSVSLLSPLVNILVLWVVPILTVYGGFTLLLPAFLGILSHYLSWLLELLLSYFIFVVTYFGNLPMASFNFELTLPSMLFYFIFVLVIGFSPHHETKNI